MDGVVKILPDGLGRVEYALAMSHHEVDGRITRLE